MACSTVSQMKRPAGSCCSSAMCATSPAAREITAKPRMMPVGTPISPSSAATAPVALIVIGRPATSSTAAAAPAAAHGAGAPPAARGRGRFAYAWVGNSADQCPGECAWPFHQPSYGPQAPPLVAPNADVGMDGVVINLATLLAGAVTNPYGGGFFQGPAEAPLEAVTACTGVFGAGAYPGYPGQLPVDAATGASYNAVGVAGRRFLLPAMWDPKTSQCSTLV